MLKYQIENVDNLPQAKGTEFGFNSRCGVIRDSDAVVGFYNFYMDGPELHLQELEILMEYQGKGYGTEFIKLLFEHHPEVNVITGQATEESAAFYEALGAEWSDTCADCSHTDCTQHPQGTGADDHKEETCDEYSEHIFFIYRDPFFFRSVDTRWIVQGQTPGGQWVRGYYVCYGGAVPGPSHHIIHAMDNLNRLVGENHEISQYNLSRCIGLFSADKKLLFENDVVEYGPEKTRVLIQWDLKSMAYKAEYSIKLEEGRYETKTIPCDMEFQHNIGNFVSRGAGFHRILTEDAERRGISPWRI